MNTPLEDLYDVDDLPSDTRVLGGRVVVDVRIGRGGAATVYAATTADGRDVALKVMTAAYAKIPSSRQRFRNEFAAAQHLADHPFVVTPYETGELAELGGRPYILMPLVKGYPLALLVGQLPVLDAVTLMRDLARVVADVHARGIIHRDIKPGNVIVRDDGLGRMPYLLDFGLAYSFGATNAPITVGLTAAHELPGTKHYMAPEQVLGAQPDPRFDVYALAITLWEVLTGVLPLEGLTPADAARRKIDAGLPSLSIAGKVPGLSQELERVIDAALERDPAGRTASAGLFAEQLTGALAGVRPRGVVVGQGAAAEPAVVVVEPGGSAAASRWMLRSIAAAIFVCAPLGAGWMLRRPSASEREDLDGAGAVGVTEASEAPARAEGPEEAIGPHPSVEVAPPPEPKAEIGPEPEAKAEPAPASGKAKRRPKGPVLDAVEQPCPDAAAQAQAARRRRQWDQVLQLTKSRCWDDDVQRIRLRVQALMELRRHRECVALGAQSRDPEVVRLVKTCATRLEEEKSL